MIFIVRGKDIIIIGDDEPNPWAVETAMHLLKYDKYIKERLRKEGIPVEKTRKVYEVCNNCAIYNGNFTVAISEDIFGLTGKYPKPCWGIKIIPSLDKDNKLVFYSNDKCEGYVNLKEIKENSE